MLRIDIVEDGKGYSGFTPLNFANAMVNQGVFKRDELMELAEYLLVFCQHNEDDESRFDFRKAFGTIDEMHEAKVDIPDLFIRRCTSQ